MSDSRELIEFRALVEGKTTERNLVMVDRARKQEQLAEVERRIAASTMADTGLLMSRDQLKNELGRVRDAIGRIDTDLGKLGNMFAGDPCDAGTAEPLLLLPVRLETRFRDVGGATQLLVRIFPDTVHIDRLKRGLSAAEREAGKLYWTALRDGGVAATVWATLGESVGRGRAAWVAQSMRPLNKPPEPPKFPPVEVIADEATIARLLPDRFVAVARQKGKTVKATGNSVPASLRLGLFLNDEVEGDVKTINGLPTGPGSEWIASYAEAEKIGMAITLTLPANTAVDTLIVTGVRQSLSPAAAGKAFEALLDAHSFSDGISFVPQGTPTNSLDSDRAGAAADVSAPYHVTSPAAKGNAARLSEALGISRSIFARADHASDDEDGLAAAVNTALWWPSWGNFLDIIDVTGREGEEFDLSDEDLEKTRRFHRDRVRGRGPLPTLRIGKQPYGVLPVGKTDDWALGGYDAKLLNFVKRVRKIWRQSLDRVPRIGEGPVDATTLELLGSSPVSLGVRARAALTSYTVSKGETTGAIADDEGLEALLHKLVWQQLGIVELASATPIDFSLDAKSKPVFLPLAHDTDPKRLAEIKNRPKKGGDVTSILQALAAIGAADARSRSTELATPGGAASDYTGFLAGLDRQQTVVAGRFTGLAGDLAAGRAVDLVAVTDAADQLYRSVSAGKRARSYAPGGGTQSFVELSRATTDERARVEFNREVLPAIFVASAIQIEVEAALDRIGAATTEQRRIATAEALDIASHRLDAWVTGIVEERRLARRAAAPKGIAIGAWGIVHDIKRGGSKGEYGFVQAPSPEQAVTAGLLRSAYLAHAKEKSEGAFAINLSSARVRDAMDLLDSMRSGQGLGEALGYRIERALHDGEPRLDRVIRNLRRFAPLRLGKLNDRGQNIEPVAQETVAGATVIDGVALLERFKKDGNIAAIAAAAFAKPADNPYLDPDKWPAVTPAENEVLLEAVKKAAAAVDAAGDLLLAESVHQMAQGNMPRASAALDAGGTGDAPPPIPAVVLTPADGGALTHRVMIVLAPGPGWGPNSPRGNAEPRLEALAAARLGPPSKVVVGKGANNTLLTLDQVGLSAIDFVYLSGNPKQLEARIASTLKLPSGTKLTDTRDPAWPAGLRAFGDVAQAANALRRVIATAVVASPKDLSAPNDPNQRVVDPSLAEAVTRLKASVASLESQVVLADALQLEALFNAMAGFGIVAPSGGIRPEIKKLVLAEARQRLAAAKLVLAKPPSQTMLTEGAQAIFGEGFWIFAPMAAPPLPDAWSTACAHFDTLAKPSAVRRWLADIGSVRPQVRDYADSLLLSEAIGAPVPRIGAVQVRRVDLDPPVGTVAWVGEGPADAYAASWVLEVPPGFNSGQPTAALLVDAHVEALVDRKTRTTGVAFNAPSPSSRPPQTWLLGTADGDKRWTTDSVIALIDDTMELAKLRGLTLERLKTAPHILPALYQQSHSLQGDELILQLTPEPTFFLSALAFIKED